MDKPISKGKFNVGHGLLLILLAVGVFFFSRYFFRESFALRYVQIDRLILSIVFTSLFGFGLIKGASEFKAVDIYKHHLKLKWLWGLISIKLYPSDITQYGVTYTSICLRKGKTDILLVTKFMNNDHELIEQLTHWRVKRRDNMRFNETTRLESRLGKVALVLLMGIFCIAAFYSSCMDYQNPISYESLVQIHGHLYRPPQINTTRSGRFSSIDLIMEEHSSIWFNISGAGFNTKQIPEVKDFQAGTPVTLWISKDMYQKKITHTAEPRFSERHFSWNKIETFEVDLNGNKILELSKYNKETGENASSKKGWVFPLILVFFVIVYFALRTSPTK